MDPRAFFTLADGSEEAAYCIGHFQCMAALSQALGRHGLLVFEHKYDHLVVFMFR